MNPQLLYQQDPSVLKFEATPVEILTLPDGRSGVVLDRTYFYPTGGGQEHDTGLLGTARVVDVFKDEHNDRLIHVIEGGIEKELLIAQIDPERRLRHMQHHTAQHLLTQCILRQADFETVSANINGYSPSTLDLATNQISRDDLERAELEANRVIYENKSVKTYFVSPEELKDIPLRRPPKVTENIRIVEIEGFDYSPCGGTHVSETGRIGLVKVLKTERQNDKTRVFFVAGMQAFELFRQMFDTFSGLANRLSTSWQELPDLMGRQADQLSSLQKEIQAFRLAGIKSEALQLAAGTQEQNGVKQVVASFRNRSVAELRQLAEELKGIPALEAFLASYDGQKVTLLVTCGEGVEKDARQLLSASLTQINGRGGGDARLSQGGGAATEDQFQEFLRKLGS